MLIDIARSFLVVDQTVPIADGEEGFTIRLRYMWPLLLRGLGGPVSGKRRE